MGRRVIKSSATREAERAARKAAKAQERRVALARLKKYIEERDAVRRAREVATVVRKMRQDADAKVAAATAVVSAARVEAVPGALDEQRTSGGTP